MSTTGDGSEATGTETDGTFFVANYDPNAPVISWRQKLELASICIFSSLTCIVMIARLWYRWLKIKRIQQSDVWIFVAFVCMIPWTTSLIGSNMTGGGLHFENVTKEWRIMHWHWQIGWAGYWIVVSCLRTSVCCFLLEILPPHLKWLRYSTFALCAIIFALLNVMFWPYLFQCQPVSSNFVWLPGPDSCLNWDYFRWTWIGFSVIIDFCIAAVPIRMLAQSTLKAYEKIVLRLVLGATLLGTFACILGIYGAYEQRVENAQTFFWDEVPFVIFNGLEVLMYTFGASFLVLSRHIVQRAPTTNPPSNFSSWARRMPDFFSSNSQGNNPATGTHREAGHETQMEQRGHEHPLRGHGITKLDSDRDGSGEVDLEKDGSSGSGQGSHN